MKIAYGTYGMPGMPMMEALPRLKRMGYEGVELCVGERYTTAPGKLSAADRKALRKCLMDLGLELPALMILSRIMVTNPDEYRKELDAFHAAGELARDLTLGSAPPVLTTVLGGGNQTWEKDYNQIVERVAEWAQAAAKHGTKFALEPHVGGLLDRPERAIAILKAVNSPALGLNFDISHFAVQGMPMGPTVAALAPHAIHTHVKDGRMENGKVKFLLPGEGDFDYAAYFRAMAKAGWKGCITVEISGMIFNAPGYDPWKAAEFSWKTLSAARKAAGVTA
jgi:sugar phosphate isomerase/epimerase